MIFLSHLLCTATGLGGNPGAAKNTEYCSKRCCCGGHPDGGLKASSNFKRSTPETLSRLSAYTQRRDVERGVGEEMKEQKAKYAGIRQRMKLN